jgi:hypothetical protein
VGCQNYDDQFDDLNAQISALKSQVDGLSSLSGQVSSLSGTISGLSSGVAAAQAAATAAGASADAATAAASAIDLSGLSASLATLQTEVDAVQASLATAATASAVTSLQSELDAIELSLADLLATSNIYSSNVSVTNATTLNAALALGNKLNVLNANLTITGYSGMSYANVQTLVDRINTMTGDITYTAAGSTGTEIVFNNLTSVGNITMTQPGGYHFPLLSNAALIDMKDDYETTVTRVNFPVLTSVTGIKTDAVADKVEFTYATSVNFASLATMPGTSMTIVTKKDADLNLGSWVSKDAAGNYINFTLDLNGPATWTNGTAAGTFASTGLPGQTVGMHDGSITLANVATTAIHNFRGTIDINAGVKSITGNNIVSIDLAGATDAESLDLTMMRDNDPGDTAATDVAQAKSSSVTQDVSITASYTKLGTIKMRGDIGDVVVNAAPALTSVDLATANAFDVTVHNNTALTTYAGPAKAEDFIFDNNDLMTSLTANHTTTLTVTGDKAVSVSVDGNAELTSATLGMDDVESLSIETNPKLATIAAAGMTDNGTSTTTSVAITGNAFVASLVRDSKEAPSATVVVGAASDTGAITSASGLSTLDTFLADALAAAGTVSVWFDTVTKLEIQATYGGTYTDTTSSLTAPTSQSAAEAVDFSTSYTGYYAYLYNVDVAAGTTTTTGAISKQRVSYAYNLNRNTTTQVETALTTAEGIELFQNDVLLGAWDAGDSYTGSANGATVVSLTDLINFINADTSMDTGYNLDMTAAQDGAKRALYVITYTNSTGAAAVAGAVSTSGVLNFEFGTNKADGSTKSLSANVTASGVAGGIATGIVAAINSDGTSDYTGTIAGNANSFYVTSSVSGSNAIDISPMATFPTLVLNTNAATTTAVLTPAAYTTVSASNLTLIDGTATEVNTLGQSQNLFSLSAASSVLSGLRLTITNNGDTTGGEIEITQGNVSNGGIISALLGSRASNPAAGLMTAGTNIVTFGGSNGEASANYVAAFSAISAGTTTTTGAVTAVLTNRTGW